MSRRSNVAKARKRIASVFTYLQELYRVRTPPVVDLDRYEWKLRLAEVPGGDSIRWSSRLTAWAPAGSRSIDGALLRVGRPKEVPCPEPPPMIRSRLRTGWDIPDGVAILREVPAPVPDTASPGDVAGPREAFDDWVQKRDRWALQQAPLALFQRLYELWTRFERESEKYQLYIGDGILRQGHGEEAVRHPVLLQRLDLRFDPRVPAFDLAESEEAPVLYLPMLRHLAVDGKALLQLQERFRQNICDPMGAADTEEFLQFMIHGLWPDGEFVTDAEAARRAAGPVMYRDPVLYLGHRSQDYVGAIDRYLEVLEERKEPPTALMRVVGIDTGDEREAKELADPLLTRPANAEQLRVLRRLEETGAVLVQGPPGTGKSHTIANLVGHLLAENKTILVTSHASKALRVVREKVAEPLQSLCVSLLDSDEDSNRQLEESITGILNYFSQTTTGELNADIAELATRRLDVRARRDELAAALEAAVLCEYGDLEVDGERVPIGEVVRELLEARGKHDWLPGPVHAAEIPLDDDEVNELYQLVAKIGDKGDRKGADTVLPDLEKLPTPDAFIEFCNRRTRAGNEAEATSSLWLHDDQSDDELAALEARVAEAASMFDHLNRWVAACLRAGTENREAQEPWRQLVMLIDECNARIPPRMTLVLEHGPKIHGTVNLADSIDACDEIIAHLQDGKKLKKLLKAPRFAFVSACTVDGGVPETVEHFRAIADLLEIWSLRDQLVRRWDRQLVPLGAPSGRTLGGEPEKNAAPYGVAMARALRWSEDAQRPCERALAAAGLDLPTVVASVARPSGPDGALLQLRALYTEVLPPVLAARRNYLRWAGMGAKRDGWLEHLDELAGDGKDARVGLVRDMARAVRHAARDTYGRLWNKVARSSTLVPAIARRDELLARIDEVAPAWAEAIRTGPPGSVPGAGDAWAAWSYRVWADKLEAATSGDVDRLQSDLNRASRELQDVTAQFVEKLAWRAQFERTGLEEQQALAGWLALHKKIGKGSGKNAPRLKEEAKRTLVKCREAVPVWIMPLSRVIESFDLATTRFDVVILDEASQCDILGLAAFAMASEIAVVGDHEQVSPYAVGLKIDKIQGLIDELLDDIPNKQLYDGKTSVYDLARQSFGGTIRLLEHFRCVPEIIEYSNQLCYAGDIRPLREASSATVGPPLVVHRVEGGFRDGKVNEPEAQEIAALVSAMCEMPEYDGCTIGVISMVGTEQALLVDSLLRQHLPVGEYQRRRLLCGNASQFQGDERDVIFVSIVDASRGKRLPIRRSDDAKKLFNVAASRARDQLWVVHSLEAGRDLKEGDLRLSLIAHARDPGAVARRVLTAAAREASPFERDLAADLRDRGFTVTVHCPIGAHVVDLVIEGDDGKRVAVQCDGGRQQSADDVRGSLQRQLTLERLGWHFIRVRASGFALDRKATVDALAARVEDLGIAPSKTGHLRPAQTPATDDLRDRVLARAAQILRGSRVTLRAVTGSDG